MANWITIIKLGIELFGIIKKLIKDSDAKKVDELKKSVSAMKVAQTDEERRLAVLSLSRSIRRL